MRGRRISADRSHCLNRVVYVLVSSHRDPAIIMPARFRISRKFFAAVDFSVVAGPIAVARPLIVDTDRLVRSCSPRRDIANDLFHQVLDCEDSQGVTCTVLNDGHRLTRLLEPYKRG